MQGTWNSILLVNSPTRLSMHSQLSKQVPCIIGPPKQPVGWVPRAGQADPGIFFKGLLNREGLTTCMRLLKSDEIIMTTSTFACSVWPVSSLTSIL